jgi:hypothetical protein
LRCKKYGVQCEGYDDLDSLPTRSKTKPAVSVAVIRKLAPNFKSTSSPQPEYSILKSLLTLPTESALDFQYFRQFQEQTASNFSGYFHDQIWKDLLLQASHQTPSIRDAVIGLGALDKTSQVTRGSPEAMKHYNMAIQKYGRSLKEMAQGLEEKQDLRQVLLYCLLSFCFEAWNGYPDSAISQIRYGLKYIRKWLDETTSSTFSKSEIELLHLFSRLENSSIVNLGTKLEDSSTYFRSKWFADADSEIPDVFENIEDARTWHELIVGSMFASMIRFQKAQTEVARGRNSPPPAPDIFIAMGRQAIVRRFEKWHDSFLPLLLESRQSPDKSSIFAGATALELRYKATSRCLSGTIGLSETAYDAFNSDFAESIELAQTLLDHMETYYNNQKGIATFTIDGVMVPSMYIIATKCRDPVIRRRAVRILEENPRREGLWDSSLIAKIGRLSIAIEEEGVPFGIPIPEHARIVGIVAFSSMVDRKGTMTYMKKEIVDNVLMPTEHQVEFTW